MAQWRRQNRPHAQPLAGRQIDVRIVLASWQSTTSPVRTQSAEMPESDWRRTPRSGAVRPARARHTISSPLRSAMAAPLAPVSVCARSAITLMAGSRSISVPRAATYPESTPRRLKMSTRRASTGCAREPAKRTTPASDFRGLGNDEAARYEAVHGPGDRVRHRQSDAQSAGRVAIPPSTRERPITAWLPHARQRGVLFSLINSHATQSTAVCKPRK